MARHLPQSKLIAREREKKRADFVRHHAACIAARIAYRYDDAPAGADRCAYWCLHLAERIWNAGEEL